MKTQHLIVLALVAALASAVAVVIAYDETTACPSTELIKLAPLVDDENVAKCRSESTWEMLPPAGYPTDAQRVLMCDSVACFNVIAAVKRANVSDCLLAVGDVQFNAKKLTDEFEPSCYH